MNSSADLYAALLKKGMTKEQAFFAVLDNFRELHCFDRNHYQGVVTKQAEEITRLKARVAKLEGQDE